MSKEAIDSSWTAGVRLGLIETDTHAFELEYDFLGKADLKKEIGTGKSYGNEFFGNYLYHFQPQGEVLRPYLLGGVGYETWTSGEMRKGGLGAVGAGIKYALSEVVQLRAEVKDVIRLRDGGQTLAYSVGLSMPFGKVPASAPLSENPLSMNSLDSDSDGVVDGRDKCPDTPIGSIVDDHGCAVEKDSDGDGVPDSIDQCPHTPAGYHVDQQGCAIGVTLYLHFPFDSAKIPASEFKTLEDVASYLKSHPKVTATLEGHTDNVGTEAYNLRLSKRRAVSVQKALIQRGIDASRLSVRAYGESRPAVSNATPEGRAKNRRVEVVIVHPKYR